MTPKQITTIDLKELKEIELLCECGASIRLPLPLKPGNPVASQPCPGCARSMWEGAGHPTRLKIERLSSCIQAWQETAHPTLAVRFVITETVDHEA